MPRETTAERVIRECGIPPGDVAHVMPGVVAVRPSWKGAIVAKYPAQPQYLEWLSRDYRASKVVLNSAGEHMWSLHKGPGAAAASTALVAADNMRYSVVGGIADVIKVHVMPGVPVSSPPTAKVLVGAVPAYPGQLYANEQGPASVTGSARAFNGIVLGQTTSWKVLRGSYFYGNQQPQNADTISEEVRLDGVVPLPASSHVDWLLISGPTALTRGEVYTQGVWWFAVESVEMALLLEAQARGTADRNEADRLLRDAEKARARGRDLSVMGQLLGLNPYRGYMPTRALADEYLAASGTSDGIDIGALNAKLRAGNVFYAVVSMSDSLDVTPIVLLEGVTSITITVGSTGECVYPGQTQPLDVDGLPSMLVALKDAGVSFEIVRPPPADFTVNQSIDYALDVAQRGLPDGADLWGDDGDRGAISLAAISAAARPLTSSQREVVRAALVPAVMETLIPV